MGKFCLSKNITHTFIGKKLARKIGIIWIMENVVDELLLYASHNACFGHHSSCYHDSKGTKHSKYDCNAAFTALLRAIKHKYNSWYVDAVHGQHRVTWTMRHLLSSPKENQHQEEVSPQGNSCDARTRISSKWGQRIGSPVPNLFLSMRPFPKYFFGKENKLRFNFTMIWKRFGWGQSKRLFSTILLI